MRKYKREIIPSNAYGREPLMIFFMTNNLIFAGLKPLPKKRSAAKTNTYISCPKIKALAAPIVPNPCCTRKNPATAVTKLDASKPRDENCNFLKATNMPSKVKATACGTIAREAKSMMLTLNLSASKKYKKVAKTAKSTEVNVSLNMTILERSSSILFFCLASSLIKYLLMPKSATDEIIEK